jgi:hypothetical protein
MASPEASCWRKAVEECLKAHQQLGAFVEEEVTARKKVLPTRWVFALKTSQVGNVTKFKARFVVKGFLQRKGVDYNQVFSPAMRGERWRLMVAVATALAGDLGHSALSKADVVNVYLQAPLPEDEMVLFALARLRGVRSTVCGWGWASDRCPQHQGADGAEAVGPRVVSTSTQLPAQARFSPSLAAPCLYVKEVDGGFVLDGIFVDDLIATNATGNRCRRDLGRARAVRRREDRGRAVQVSRCGV